jgi:hypothetical protein
VTSDNVPDKVCLECGLPWPATTTYYHKSKDGFHARCRKCRNKKLKKERAKKTDTKLDEIESGAVKLFVAASRIGGANIPHSSELLEVMMEYFGGVRGFTNVFVKQFFDAPVGGAFRTKMLDSVVRLVTNNTAMGGAKKPLELMSEEELENEIRRQVLEAAMQMKKVEVVDAVRKLPLVVSEPTIRDGFVQEVPADMGEERRGATPSNDADQQLRGME